MQPCSLSLSRKYYLDNVPQPEVEPTQPHPTPGTMTNPTTHTREQPYPNRPPAGSDFLLSLIVTLIAPIFYGVTGGDVALARLAALETVNDYRARNNADLLVVAQIVGFGLAALGSLSLSMAEDLSLSMILRFRGNAMSCNRAAEQNRRARRALQDEPQTRPPAEPEPVEVEPAPQSGAFLNPDAAHLLAAESRARLEQADGHNPIPKPTQSATRTPAEKRHQEMWGIALAKESSEITDSLPRLPPAEREAAEMRAGLLGSTAHDLIYGAPEPPLKLSILNRVARPTTSENQPPR
jgi:hypothetical protein